MTVGNLIIMNTYIPHILIEDIKHNHHVKSTSDSKKLLFVLEEYDRLENNLRY